MTIKEIIMAIFDTSEMNPEIVEMIGYDVHSTEELKVIIKEILYKQEPKRKFKFGPISRKH